VIEVCRDLRGRRKIIVLVVLLVIGRGEIEDENEDKDDLLVALPRCEVCELRSGPQLGIGRRGVGGRGCGRREPRKPGAQLLNQQGIVVAVE